MRDASQRNANFVFDALGQGNQGPTQGPARIITTGKKALHWIVAGNNELPCCVMPAYTRVIPVYFSGSERHFLKLKTAALDQPVIQVHARDYGGLDPMSADSNIAEV